MIDRKLTLKDKKLLLSFSILVIILLIIYSIFFSPLFSLSEPDEGEDDDWENYPYVIPGTDMRFPDDEGRYTEGAETWISVGFEIELQDFEWDDTYLVILYHDDYKNIYLSHQEETYTGGNRGDQDLPAGELDMTFDNSDLDTEDVLRLKEGEAFHYEFESYFELNDKEFEIDMELEAKKPPATMTDLNGRVDLGNEHYKFHALTHCNISGNIQIDDVVLDAKGVAWLENLRGSFRHIEWQWFAFWNRNNIDMKIVDAYGGEDNVEYGMYVDEKGDIITIEDIKINVTSLKNGFGYTWEITSDNYPIDLNITSIDERMNYGWFAFGFGRVEGELMGEQIDTLTYIELTNR